MSAACDEPAPAAEGEGFQAFFFDGRTATRHAVQVALTEAGLVITGTGDETRATWPYRELAAGERLRPDRAAYLSHPSADGARLLVEDTAFTELLLRRAPWLRRRFRPSRSMAVTGIAVSAFVAALLVGTVYGLPLLVPPLAAALPLSWETELGDQVVDGILGDASYCRSEAGTAALDRLVTRLAAQVETPYSFRVAVADIAKVNAFAAPGGRIVLFRGLIEQAESPEEVAGVLAHEMGHVVERHPTISAIRVLGYSALLDVMLGDSSAAVEVLASVGGVLLALSYNREQEGEADRIALDIVGRAGIEPKGLAEFFERLARDGEASMDGPRILGYLSTHPPLMDRHRLAAAASTAHPSPAMSKADWAALRAVCG